MMPDPRLQESMIDRSTNVATSSTTAERAKPCFQFGAVASRHLLRSPTGAKLYTVAVEPRRFAVASLQGREVMYAIRDVDLSTFCGTIGTLYRKHRLCPPFLLHDAAQGWIAKGTPLTHCVDVIERFLSRHAGSCHSGSGDWNFAWLNSLIQTTSYKCSFARPPGPAPQQSRYHSGLDGVEEPNQKRRRRAAFTAGVPKPDKSASREQIAPRPKKIDIAVAWLRTELATGERAAAEVEAEALCDGIAPRTYDRARERIGVTSRRIGFGRWAKYVIALPMVDGTPGEGANKVGAAWEEKDKDKDKRRVMTSSHCRDLISRG